jgi:hypothetical protein
MAITDGNPWWATGVQQMLAAEFGLEICFTVAVEEGDGAGQ